MVVASLVERVQQKIEKYKHQLTELKRKIEGKQRETKQSVEASKSGLYCCQFLHHIPNATSMSNCQSSKEVDDRVSSDHHKDDNGYCSRHFSSRTNDSDVHSQFSFSLYKHMINHVEIPPVSDKNDCDSTSTAKSNHVKLIKSLLQPEPQNVLLLIYHRTDTESGLLKSAHDVALQILNSLSSKGNFVCLFCTVYIIY